MTTAEGGDQSAERTGELLGLQEQVQQARAVLAQLHEAAIAVESRFNGQHATQLVAANEQLVVAALRSETRFRAYFDVSPELLYLLRLTANDQFIVEDVDPAGAGLYGLPREQIIGRTPAELDPADGGTGIASNARTALRVGKAVTYELTRTFGSREQRGFERAVDHKRCCAGNASKRIGTRPFAFAISDSVVGTGSPEAPL